MCRFSSQGWYITVILLGHALGSNLQQKQGNWTYLPANKTPFLLEYFQLTFPVSFNEKGDVTEIVLDAIIA